MSKVISNGYILPSSCLTIDPKIIKNYAFIDHEPSAGDLIYGKIVEQGHHTDLENRNGRIHQVGLGNRAIFVMGNRYAPDYYEGFVPEQTETTLDLLARSGMVGKMRYANEGVKSPTKVKFLGYVVDKDLNVLNTRQRCLINPTATDKKYPRSKMIVVVGSSMNAGKSQTASAICWALSNVGKDVRASKITGTASLKDILLMEDSGASNVNDFTYLGHPSTYMLDESELMDIFDRIDLKYCNNPRNYWVVEIADGVLQREAEILLKNRDFRARIHKLVLAGRDAASVIGTLNILKEKFDLVPDGISGVCTSSPLFVKEFEPFTNVPVFANRRYSTESIMEIVE